MVIQCGGCFQHPIKPKRISSTPNWLEAQIIGTSHWPCGFSGARVCTRQSLHEMVISAGWPQTESKSSNTNWSTSFDSRPCHCLALSNQYWYVNFIFQPTLRRWKTGCAVHAATRILLNSDFVFEQIVKIYDWMILDTSGYMAIHSNTMTRRTRIDLLGPCWIMISVDAKALWADGPAAASSTARCKTYSIIRRHRTLRSAVHPKIAGI